MNLLTTTITPNLTAEQKKLIEKITEALTAYEMKRPDIVQAALAEGGNARVQEVEDEYLALRDARREVRRHQLDTNDEKYATLMQAAIQETTKIKGVINSLNSIASVMDSFSKTISLIGRVLLILG